MRIRAVAASPLLVALVLSAAACTSQDDPVIQASQSFNDADVTFLQSMIPHHEQAVEMAELVEGRTTRQELRDLAAEVTATQAEEIATMQSLLAEVGENESPAGHDMSSMAGDPMPGMMNANEMEALATLSGNEFDLAFVDMMTRHHEGAIQMSETVLEDGADPRVQDLAEAIITAQAAEIDQMRQWRTEWA